MMNFQFTAGEGGSWDISFIGPIIPIIIFAIPVFIFWRARTRIFFLIFSVALFWIIAPVFFQAITVLIIGLAFVGIVLVLLAFKRGYISKKKAGALAVVMAGLGGGIFYWLMSTDGGSAETRPGEGILPWGENGSLLGDLQVPGLFILILISLFAVGFFFYQKYDLFELFGFMEDEDEKKELERDISSTVDKAIRDLLEGKDIESTIMECYNQMSLILEKRGIKDEAYMTPREFEEAANENLDITTSKISRIREIFELAKYSSHKLKQEDKEKVIEDLEALKEELG
ncbi:MAG: DUF4129 domain-containing protein [Candidatus Thermoplasmatota archaeon]